MSPSLRTRRPVGVRLQPSGEHTAEQARNLAIASFRRASRFAGSGVPTEATVQDAIDAAIDAAAKTNVVAAFRQLRVPGGE
jgi:hypothetical protein